MKRIVFTLLLLVGTVTPARPLDVIKKSGVLRVAVDGETPGFNFFKGKKLTGFEVDLAALMAKSLGLQIQWTVQPFNTLLVGLAADRFDVIATSHAITAERDKVADFLTPHYCTGAVIVSKKGGPKTEKELSGKVVVVPVGTTYYNYLKKNASIKDVKTLPNENAGLQDLTAGKADAWVTEQFVAYHALKAHPQEHLQIGDILFSQENAMVVAQGNTSLKSTLDGALNKLLADGNYIHLSEKYFKRDIRCK